MTQQQLAPPVALQACANGHAARYMLDVRALRAGGGHFIECECRATPRAADFDAALREWFRVNGRRRTRAKPIETEPAPPRGPRGSSAERDAATLLQFRLPLRSAER